MPTTNEYAEQYLLGCLLVDDSLMDECILQPEHFAVGVHQVIFKAMRELEVKSERIDIFSISSKTANAVEIKYLSDLISSLPTSQHFQNNQRAILDAWKLRTAERVANELRDEIQSGSDPSAIHHAIQRLSNLDEVGTEEEFDIQEVLREIFDDAEEDKGDLTGITTGYDDLNAFTGGWQNGDLIVVGARPSVGKTAFALNMGVNAAQAGAVVSIFSLEMSDKSILKRIISSNGMIDATHMRNPRRFFSDNDWPKFSQSISDVANLPLFIYDKSSPTVQEIRATVRKLKQKFPDRKHLCIIDYLQLIRTPRRENRTVEVGDVSRTLKQMAREYDMPVIALSQLNRDSANKADKRPQMSDIRESGSIEQDADVIALLHRDDYYDAESEKKNVIEVILAKQRNGPVGKVELVFLKQFNKFVNLAKAH